MNTPITYHGTWWFPTEGLISPHRKDCKNVTGTLTYYGNKPTKLELYFTPQDYERAVSTLRHPMVIFGETADGHLLSIFGAHCVSISNWTCSVYEVDCIIDGIHLLSKDTKIVSRAIVKYPNLVNWCYKPRVESNTLKNKDVVLTLNMHSNDYIFDATIDNDVRIYGLSDIKYNWKKNRGFQYNITEDTKCGIAFKEPKGLEECLEYIAKFSDFLSFAIFAQQHPTSICLTLNNDSKVYLMFRIKESSSLYGESLLKHKAFSDKIPAILAKWFSVYTELSPIVRQLLRDRNYDLFDTSHFASLAQVLDGYFKRFINKLDGKDIRQYKEEINILLERLKNVNAITSCKIDADVLTESRHKYTHYTPSGDNPKAVKGYELLQLPHKCRVLLACCILDCLGLSNEEINVCCKDSEIEYIINEIGN